VACIDGIITIEDNRAIIETSVVSKNDILTAKNAQEYVEYTRPKSFYGGSFMKKLGKMAKVAVKHGPEAYKLGKKAVNLGGRWCENRWGHVSQIETGLPSRAW